MKYVNCKKLLFGLLIILLLSMAPHAIAQQVFNEGLPVDSTDNQNLKPFGANLFAGEYTSRKASELDPNYRVEAGDRIAVRMWGAVSVNEVLTVDANGNIFIPDVGELAMAGTRAADVSNRVQAAAAKVYTDGVDVYANLLTASPKEVRVFVTGGVVRPGQYLGLPDDSLLSFLQQAGGIDRRSGSYRHIIIKRNGQRLTTADLYNFLLNGNLPALTFRDGDTIVVQPQHSMVNVLGQTRNNYRFEFIGQTLTGQQLVRYARPDKSVTNVAVSGTRNGQPWSAYLSYAQFLQARLYDGDTLRFVSDAPSAVIDVSIEGSYLGESYFAVEKGSRLQEVLDHVAVDPNIAAINAIYIKRKSVALQQKKNIEKTLQRLERSVLTTPASSDGEASLRAKEAELILKFVERASQIEPEGRVVVSQANKTANILLEDGDVIVIPQKSDLVTVSGEVQVPKALVYASNATLLDYIAQAGGYTERANQDELLIVKPNGRVIMGQSVNVEPGDEITVLPKIEVKSMQLTKDIVQIVYQIAVAARAVGL